MELEQIKVFIAVAQTGSFSLAARRLFISHSTTSRTVSALEEELGVRLIERENSRVMGLTPAGKIVLEQGGALLKGAEKLKADAVSAKNER
jgi:DNA-binding transcriptional LysR family regulator